MKVTLSDPIIMVEGWTSDLDHLGSYTLKVRKTPIEIKEERTEKLNKFGDASKIDPMRKIPKTCITKDPKDPSIAYFLLGLWPRIKKHLDSRKIAYEIVDKRNPDIRPPLDMSAFQGIEFRENQDLVLATIAASDCGIIDAGTGFGKGFIISLLCKALPTLNIVVTTSALSVVNTLFEYLCKVLPGQVGIIGGGRNIVANKRVIVSTFKSLGNIQPDKVQLLLVDECHNVNDGTFGQEIMKFAFARKFGFSASVVRNDGSGLFLESLLGPVIFKMSYQETVDAGMVTPMKYFMMPCTSCPPVAQKEMPDVFLKRWSYWCNQSRNNAIKRIVYSIKEVYNGQILIVVSTLEHAIQLHRLLPWFKVAYYGNVDMEELRAKFPAAKYPGLDVSQYKTSPKQVDIIRKAFAKGTLRYVIATKIFKQGVSFNELACLIRADGDTSEVECVQIPGRLSRLDEGKKWAYLIDFQDTFSPWAARRAKERMRKYDEQQWQQITLEELLDGLSRQSKGNGEQAAGERSGG